MTRAKDISKILTDADISGTLDVTGETTLATHLNLGDNDKIKLGASGDLEIFHNGTDSFIQDEGTGNLKIRTNGSAIELKTTADEAMVVATKDGAVELYHDNTKKFETTSTGIDITGNQSNFTASSVNAPSGGNGILDLVCATARSSGFGPYIAFHVPNSTGSTTTEDMGVIGFIAPDSTDGSRKADFIVHTRNTSFAERLRVTSDGVLLVGQTAFNPANVGTSLTASGQLNGTASGDISLQLNRTSSDGAIAQFRKDNTTIGNIGCINSTLFISSPSGGDTGLRFSNDVVHPCNTVGGARDNLIDLGYSQGRFDDIFATNGTIQTSDRNEKQDIEELNDAEKRVAIVAKGLMRKFRWKSKVEIKGDNARTHFGIIAQDLEDAFKAEGLDASKYAMFCSDTWWEKEITVDAVEAKDAVYEEVTDSDGNKITNLVSHAVKAQDAYTYTDTKQEATEGYTERTRLGVRYSELLAFIISAI